MNPFAFTLLMADGARVQGSIPVKDPGLEVGPLDPERCARGSVTYDVPRDADATAVVFETADIGVRWVIP